GELAAWAGAPYEVGDAHGHTLFPSMMFRLNNIDPVKVGDAWRTIPQLMEQAEARGTHKFPRKGAIVRPQRSGIEWRVNFTQLKRSDGGAITSMTHGGQSAARVSGACFAMGEAAGTAAALALSGNASAREVAINRLQKALTQKGAFIGRDQAIPQGV